MMFTEGLDENAINWIKQGSDADTPDRPPLIEKFPLDPISNLPLSYMSKSFLSPKVLPPSKFLSGLLGPHPNFSANSEDDNESVASVPEAYCAHYSDTFDDEGLVSSDSDLFGKTTNQSHEHEIKSSGNESYESVSASDGTYCQAMSRRKSKENLRVDIPINSNCLDGASEIRACAHKNFIYATTGPNHVTDGFSTSHSYFVDDFMPRKDQDLGTPSAPPIMGGEREENCLDVGGETPEIYTSIEVQSDLKLESKICNELPTRSISGEADAHIPYPPSSLMSQKPCFNTSIQNAWQTFVAYDACFRLCLNAWARECMEAPEFLRDECLVLRSAFGLQKLLLQPRGYIKVEGHPTDNTNAACSAKGRNGVGRIEVEVKKIRIIPRRRGLRPTYSQRAMYVQVGAEYVRHFSSMLKSHINSLEATSPVVPEESMSCLLQLKSSTEDAATDLCSSASLKPGSGDSHVFYPESQGDVLLVEVQDISKVCQGRAAIQISLLADCHRELKWFPIYLEDDACMGKVQLCISASGRSDKISPTKGGPVVETLIYDLVLEAAMRAQHFHPKNLHLNGMWEWLLKEFADYYGVSDAYAKLRYLSYIMNIATPTKDCLELVYKLFVPVVKARGDKSLTRQERSIFLDCEDQIRRLLTTAFENYKSLDEFSPTGLTNLFAPIPESAAPALVPAVQLFTLLHDVLSQEAQNILRNYLQTAAAKRCRRHMIETDEYMSGNYEGFFTDPMTICTAYLKMRALCKSISIEIQTDIKIHNQHILPSSIDLPNIAGSLYSTELCKRLRCFLAVCPPSKPSRHVIELLIATADFERDLDSWNIIAVDGGVVSRELFHNYIMVWIQDTQLHLLDLCKAEKVSFSGIPTHWPTSTFVENTYDQIRDNLNEYEVVINRWPQYLLDLENVVADVERAIIKAHEKQYSETLMPLKDGIPQIIEKQMLKLTRRQSSSVYVVSSDLGTFFNTLRRILDVLHCQVEDKLKLWAQYLTTSTDGTPNFGEQMNGVTFLLKKKNKKYMEAIVEKLISNTQGNKSTKLKRILEETKEADGEQEIRERMQPLCFQLTDSVRKLHNVFSSRIFIGICRCFWDRMGQIVLSFLESRKENRVWYRGSGYALGILDDLFASEMQTLQGNSLQDKDLDPPQSVIEARSILC